MRLVRRESSTGTILALVGLALVACSPTSSPSASAGGGVLLNQHDEAARLIDGLELSSQMRNAARDYVVRQMAEGVQPRPALARWIEMQQKQGAVVRCKPAAADCVAQSS
jgi:hypothetical protein